MIKLSDTVAVDAHELTERFVRASGPGGQNGNKGASAVRIVHRPSGIMVVSSK